MIDEPLEEAEGGKVSRRGFLGALGAIGAAAAATGPLLKGLGETVAQKIKTAPPVTPEGIGRGYYYEIARPTTDLGELQGHFMDQLHDMGFGGSADHSLRVVGTTILPEIETRAPEDMLHPDYAHHRLLIEGPQNEIDALRIHDAEQPVRTWEPFNYHEGHSWVKDASGELQYVDHPHPLVNMLEDIKGHIWRGEDDPNWDEAEKLIQQLKDPLALEKMQNWKQSYNTWIDAEMKHGEGGWKLADRPEELKQLEDQSNHDALLFEHSLDDHAARAGVPPATNPGI
jgi:hypothetical protein